MLAVKAFREGYITTDSGGTDDFTGFDARRLRYQLMFALFENTAYRDLHTWARGYKKGYGLYKYTRNLYNPAQRLGSFWQAHLWGGTLDPEAGADGCLPVITENERIRPAIAQVWKWSNWNILKDQAALQGTIKGDLFIRVVDNVDKVYLDLLDPGTVDSVESDPWGNIKAYVIREQRMHPETGRPVEYREQASRDGQNVVYETFLNNAPYPWNGVTSAWVEPYGFVPVVHIQHSNVGLGWGWSEYHPALSKIREVDDLASLLSDQVRKSVNAKWVFSGVRPNELVDQAIQETTPTDRKPEPAREENPAIYLSDPGAKAQALVANLDIEGAVLHITELLKEIEREYPELKFDAERATGELSGTALRVARQPIETKAQQRRATYDDGLVRAHMMALSIGGFRGLFRGINLDSYASGKLDHTIGERPVFALDPLEKLEEDKVFWEVAKLAISAGIPLKNYLLDSGWDQERIDKLGIQEMSRDDTGTGRESENFGRGAGRARDGEGGAEERQQRISGPAEEA